MGKRRNISPGDVVERLEILENLGVREYCGENTTYWKCRCTRCGNIIEVPQKNLGKSQKDCGCWRKMPHRIIESGSRFGRLTVINIGEHIAGKGYTYLCECSCNNHTRIYVRGDRLISGYTRSCGCIKNELFMKSAETAHSNNFVGGTSVNKIMTDKIQKNNTSGIRGVSWHKSMKKWYARISYKGITYSLGYYDDIKDAAEVVEIAIRNRNADFIEWYKSEYPQQWEKIQKKHVK